MSLYVSEPITASQLGMCSQGGYCDLCRCGIDLINLQNDYMFYMIAFWLLVLYGLYKSIDWDSFKKEAKDE